MTVPKRIQRRRTKGWKMPPGAIYVGRPHSVFQNRYKIGTESLWLGRKVATAQESVDCFVNVIMEPAHMRAYAREVLRGCDLACWCTLCPTHSDGKPFGIHCDDCSPCHADPLGEIANGSKTDGE